MSTSTPARDSPVLGLSWNDVREYWSGATREPSATAILALRPAERGRVGAAARGVDGRRFPWGERFDPLLCINLVRSAEYLIDAPGGAALSDESPYGVLDFAGSREEWLRDSVRAVNRRATRAVVAGTPTSSPCSGARAAARPALSWPRRDRAAAGAASSVTLSRARRRQNIRRAEAARRRVRPNTI